MTVLKRKKVRKYRGSHTHGGGSKKKRRGSGNRGGFGMAGTGKRADQKKPSILKEFGNAYFGKKGFVPRNKKEIKAINIGDLEKKYLAKAKKENDLYILNLNDLGFRKLLGKGRITKKLIITCLSCSKKAKDKVEKINGKIIKG